MTAFRQIFGRLVLGGALVSSAPLVCAMSAPAIPGAPAALSAESGEGLRVSIDGFELEPVTAEELAGGSELPQASSRIGATALGGSLRANGGLQVAPLQTTIRRELPAVWQFGRRVDQKRSGLPRVRVEVEGLSGRDQLVSVQGGAPLPVRVIPARVTRRVSSDGMEIFEGGVILEIPTEALQQPGRYSGRLRVTIEAI